MRGEPLRGPYQDASVVLHYLCECVGYRFALRGRAQEAIEALDAACAYRFPDRIKPAGLALRTDHGSAFGAAPFVAEVARQGLQLAKTFYRSPEGNAIVERFFRSLKEECAWQHQFRSFAEAECAITEWIRFYSEQRPHSALGYPGVITKRSSVARSTP